MVESSSSKREFFCYKNLTFRWWSCSVASTARSQGVAWFSFALGSGVGGFWFSSNFRGPNMGMMKFDETNILMKYKTRYPTGGLESPIIFNDNIYNKYTAYYISLDLFFFFAVSGWVQLIGWCGHLDEGPKYSWMGWSQEEIFNGWLGFHKGIFEDWMIEGSISNKLIIHI